MSWTAFRSGHRIYQCCELCLHPTTVWQHYRIDCCRRAHRGWKYCIYRTTGCKLYRRRDVTSTWYTSPSKTTNSQLYRPTSSLTPKSEHIIIYFYIHSWRVLNIAKNSSNFQRAFNHAIIALSKLTDRISKSET